FQAPNDSPMYAAVLTHRQASYGEGDGGSGGGLFTRGAAPTSASAYGTNGDYYQQLQAHAANTRQLLADGAFSATYSQGGGSSGEFESSGTLILCTSADQECADVASNRAAI
ncbi:hypothetical protein TSMEX_004935, partial [Taenia solium]